MSPCYVIALPAVYFGEEDGGYREVHRGPFVTLPIEMPHNIFIQFGHDPDEVLEIRCHFHDDTQGYVDPKDFETVLLGVRQYNSDVRAE